MLELRLRQSGKPSGITLVQARILIEIYHSPMGTLRLTRLSQKMGISKASLSHTLSLLTTQGFLKRSQDPQDRRSFSLRLTPKGKKLYEVIRRELIPVGRFLKEDPQAPLLLELLLRFLAHCEQEGWIPVQRMCLNCAYYIPDLPLQNQAYCAFLKKPLEKKDLRILCPDHLPQSAAR